MVLNQIVDVERGVEVKENRVKFRSRSVVYVRRCSIESNGGGVVTRSKIGSPQPAVRQLQQLQEPLIVACRDQAADVRVDRK
jgi:hypothetical protein